MPAIDFWYEFASTYSYPTAMRIEKLAADAGVTLRWRPFLLGPIFKEPWVERLALQYLRGEGALYVA